MSVGWSVWVSDDAITTHGPTSQYKYFFIIACKYLPFMRAPNKYFLIFLWTPFRFQSLLLSFSVAFSTLHAFHFGFVIFVDGTRVLLSYFFFFFLCWMKIFSSLFASCACPLVFCYCYGCLVDVLINLIYYFYNFISNGERTHSKYFSPNFSLSHICNVVTNIEFVSSTIFFCSLSYFLILSCLHTFFCVWVSVMLFSPHHLYHSPIFGNFSRFGTWYNVLRVLLS